MIVLRCQTASRSEYDPWEQGNRWDEPSDHLCFLPRDTFWTMMQKGQSKHSIVDLPTWEDRCKFKEVKATDICESQNQRVKEGRQRSGSEIFGAGWEVVPLSLLMKMSYGCLGWNSVSLEEQQQQQQQKKPKQFSEFNEGWSLGLLQISEDSCLSSRSTLVLENRQLSNQRKIQSWTRNFAW